MSETVPDAGFERLRQIIAAEFNVAPEKITRETTASDIDGWDSISHAALIVVVEKAFAVTIPDEEIFMLPDVGGLYDCLVALRSKASP